MEKITKAEIKIALGNIVKVMEDVKEELIALDGAMGDGDLGLTMCKGFQAVYDEIDKIEETDMGKIIMKLGMKMNSVVPSTMGTLVSTCFVKGAAKVKGKTELTLADIAVMGQAAVDGVKERGKSNIGDKTMLDALYPAVESLKLASKKHKRLAEAGDAAYQAAVRGVEETKNMQSRHGRAAYYSEKSVGRQDPGATAVMYMFKGVSQRFQ